ncbi:MAG: GNAT family N-acetyltransferase [Bacteroidota bacterium]
MIFLEERKLSPYFTTITNKLSGKKIFNTPLPPTDFFKRKVFTVFDIPDYLSPKLNSNNIGILHKEVKMYEGYMINLGNYNDLNDYLSKKFDSKRRSQFKGYKKRLEIVLPVDYKIYYGEISKEHYDFLFEKFLEMLKRRSAQKKILNDEIKHWKIYHELTYPRILKKEAYLAVLYHGDNPISICLNMVYDKIVYGCIKTHDIDYAKFSLGFVDLLNQLEWCFMNKFEVFDLLKGKYDYKTRWVDSRYSFTKYIIYDSRSRLVSGLASLEWLKFKILYGLANILRNWNVNIIFQKSIAAWHYWRNPKSKIPIQSKLFVESITDLPDVSKIVKIDYEKEEYRLIKKTVLDFVHRNKIHIQEVNLFNSLERKDMFFLQGGERIQKITLL